MGLGVGGGAGVGGGVCSVFVCITVCTLHDNILEMHAYACVKHSSHALVRECMHPLGLLCDCDRIHDRDRSDRDCHPMHRDRGLDLFDGRICTWACSVIVCVSGFVVWIAHVCLLLSCRTSYTCALFLLSCMRARTHRHDFNILMKIRFVGAYSWHAYTKVTVYIWIVCLPVCTHRYPNMHI